MMNHLTHAQTSIDTVKVEGYVVQEFWKSSIKANQKRLREEAKKKQRSVEIDNPRTYFFYPILKNENLKSAIQNKSVNPHTIYLSFNSSELWLRKTIIDKLGIRHPDECESVDNSPYLKMKGERKKLFKAYYVKGAWARVQIDSTDADFQKIKTRSETKINENDKYSLLIMIKCELQVRYDEFKVDRDISVTNYLDLQGHSMEK